MKYQVTISHAFEGTISAILEDAAGHGGDDEYLVRLSAVANAKPVKTTQAGTTIELDEDGLAVLREEGGRTGWSGLTRTLPTNGTGEWHGSPRLVQRRR